MLRSDGLDSILEGIPVPALVVDRDCRVRMMNEAARLASGASSELDLGERPLCSVVAESRAHDRNPLEAAHCSLCGRLHRCVESGHTYENEMVTIEVVEGGLPVRRRFLMSTAPLRFGEEPLALVCLRDVTDVLRAQRERAETQERFSRLFEGLGDIVVVHDVQGVIVEVNQTTCRSLGYSREELIGMRVDDIDAGSIDQHDFRRVLQTVFATGSYRYERTLRRRDGTTFPVEIHSSPVNLSGSREILSIVRDISEMKRYRDFNEAVLNTAAAIIVVLDSRGRLVTFNRKCEEMIGVPLHAAVGTDLISDFVHPDDAEKARAALARSLVATETVDVENRWVTPKGETLTLQWRSSRLNQEGEPLILVVAQDVTTRVQAEAKVVQMQKLEAVGRLAGGIAHEFNNVLQALSGVTFSIDASLRDPELLRQRLRDLEDLVARGTRLTRQLLSFSRRTATTTALIDLNAAIRRSFEMLGRILRPDIYIVLDLCDERLVVDFDEGQLGQVLMNLAVNSQAAMPSGGTINVTTRASGGVAFLVFRDDGEGMSEEVAGKIFEPFFSTKASEAGTGLGLSIVHGQIKAKNGSISVSSAPSAGTTMTITLPLVDRPPSTTTAPGTTPVPEAGERLTVLVVDDEPAVLDGLVTFLAKLGHSTMTARSVGSALELARRLQQSDSAPDLVLSDYLLSDGTGIELVRDLREMWPRMPVLLMSGYAPEGVDFESVGCGLLAKPFSVSDLIAGIERARG